MKRTLLLFCALLTAVDAHTDLLTSAPEWQAMPDLTVLFE